MPANDKAPRQLKAFFVSAAHGLQPRSGIVKGLVSR